MRPLWEHQKKAIELARGKSFAFFFEAGTGKTRTCIEAILREPECWPVLVLAPKIVLENWVVEWEMFGGLTREQVKVLQGPQKKKLELLETPEARVFITNYETLENESVFEKLKSIEWGALVADESHKIKNPKALRTRRACALSLFAKRRYILSGTPLLRGSVDIFSQYAFLDHGKTFGTNFFTFRNRFFEDQNRYLRAMNPNVQWANWVPIKRKEEELKSLIATHSMSVQKSECLDLPPLIRQTIQVEMTKEQEEVYREMEEDMITFVKGGVVSSNLAITKALRLQQIVSGFVTKDDGSNVVFEDTPRDQALHELLEELTQSSKVIVWACWVQNQEGIRKFLSRKRKFKFAEILGTTKDREEQMRKFREDDDVRVLIGSQGAGGIGVNLVEASYAIYYSRNFSLEHDIQSEARNYRGGSEMHDKITRIDLVTPKTIDEKVLKALSEKQEINERIIMRMYE